jgi:hypothetical protein
MKFCLKMVLVFVLVLQLTGVGVAPYYVVPKELLFAPLISKVDLDQKTGTYTAYYREDPDYWNKMYEMMGTSIFFHAHGMVYYELDSHPQRADKKFKLTFHQKTFQKSEGVSPETLAAVIISIDRGRYHNSMVRMIGNIQRGHTAEQAVNAINRIKHVDDRALVTMPVGQGQEQVALRYFRLDSGLFSPEQLAMEYGRRRLLPDPQAQIADNEQDPSFAYDYPNATQWVLSSGSAYSLTFDEATVSCDRCVAWVGGDWWFAGVERS